MCPCCNRRVVPQRHVKLFRNPPPTYLPVAAFFREKVVGNMASSRSTCLLVFVFLFFLLFAVTYVRWVMTGTPTPTTSADCALRHLSNLMSFLREGEYSRDWRRCVAIFYGMVGYGFAPWRYRPGVDEDAMNGVCP